MKKHVMQWMALMALGLLISACGGGGGGDNPLSDAKAITAYSLGGVAGTIDETVKTISVIMPYGTNVTALVATFTTTGASVSVSGVLQTSGTTANDFTMPVVYIITAVNGTTATYTVTVTVSGSAFLADLKLSGLSLDQTFQPSQLSYTASAGFLATGANVTAATEDAGATLTINGIATASGEVSAPVALATGNNLITVLVTAADGTTQKSYNVTVSREAVTGFAQRAYAKASNTGGSDSFGYPVALSGDTLAVGARQEDSNATGVNGNQADNGAVDSGAVYVFTRAGGVWSQQAYIKASNTEANDAFGSSVALSNDTLAVGARQEDSNATGVNGNQSDNSAVDSGAVYVFTRTGEVWSQQAYIKASNTEGNDAFGSSVALSNDTLAVGALGEDSNATGVNGNQADNSAFNSGAVYVFTRTGGVWTQQAYIKASNAEVQDFFGSSVALSNDTLAVGASLEKSNATGVNGNQADNSSINSGAVYVFTRTGGVWSQQAYIKASNTGDGDQFGGSVALSNDTLAVTAFSEDSNAFGVNGNQADNSAVDSGAVYVFTRTGGVWTQQAYIKASNTEAGDQFGGSVALSNDTLVVGALGEDSNATGVNGNQADNSTLNSGAVYVFR
jgi:hypothetical protein